MPTPLTVEFIGSRVNTADATTNYTATKIAGGGAAPSAQAASLFQQGTAAVATTYPSASRFVTLEYDIVGGGGTALNFNSGGNSEGQLVWVWGNALLALTSTGTNTSNAIGGMGIVLSDNATITNSWAIWTFYGAENYPGGFQKMVIDPTLRPTASGGTFAASSLASIRKIGIFFVSDSAAKGGADAAIVDAIDVGSGLRIFGSGTRDGGFNDLLEADEGNVTNQYGVIRSLGGSNDIVQFQGVLEIGSGASTSTYFDDVNRVVAVRSPQYIATDGTTRFAPSIPTDFQRVTIQGNATSGTFVQLGEKVGAGDTARGRNGIIFLGNSDYDISFQFDDGNVQETFIYGTTIRSFNGTMDWFNTVSGHEFIGSVLDGCSQLNASSGVKIRNSTFQNHTGLAGAIIWNTGMDIKNCIFVANSNSLGSGAGIEHAFSGTFTYDNLQFSNNDFDINFSLATSGDLLIQATNGTSASTYKLGNSNSTVTIENSVTVTIVNLIAGTEVRIYDFSTKNQRDGTESSNTTFEFTYNYTGDFHVDIVLHNLDYKWQKLTEILLSSSAQSIPVSQIFDRDYENP